MTAANPSRTILKPSSLSLKQQSSEQAPHWGAHRNPTTQRPKPAEPGCSLQELKCRVREVDFILLNNTGESPLPSLAPEASISDKSSNNNTVKLTNDNKRSAAAADFNYSQSAAGED